jgi:hypothetical protein
VDENDIGGEPCKSVKPCEARLLARHASIDDGDVARHVFDGFRIEPAILRVDHADDMIDPGVLRKERQAS